MADDEQGTLEKIGVELAKIFEPLKQALEEPSQFIRFMFELGWSLDTVPEPIKQLLPKLNAIVDVVGGLSEGEYPPPQQIPDLINNTVAFIRDIKNLKDAPAAEFPPELVAQNFLVDFPVQLFSYLVATYLKNHQPIGFGVLSTLGLIEELKLKSDEPPEKIYYYIAWKDIPKLLTEPTAVLERAYGWGTSDFNPLLVYRNFGFLMNALGIPSYFKLLDAQLANPLEESPSSSGDILRESLRTPLYRVAADEGEISGELGFGIYGVPGAAGRKPGLSFLPYALGTIETSIQLSEHIKLVVEGNADINVGLGIIVRPEEPVHFIVNLLPESGSDAAPPASASFAIKLAYAQEGLPSQVLIGRSDGSRLEVKSISLGSSINVASDRDSEFKLEIELQGGRIVIQGGDGDGFLQSILGDGINANFELAIGWSSLTGIYFRGSGGLEINLPTHIVLGPFEIQNLILSLIPKNGTMPVNVGASIKANLGPLQAVVENMGLRATFSFPDSGGNLGPLDIELGFKSPNGVGLSLDAGAVKGGGYLFFDFDREEYAGALELVFSEWIALKAIGLITTKMPDGSKGFSLLIIITVEFGTGIQLGFGFTLNGVGGILGLNRIVNIDPLKEGVRTGAVESVMFPEDVVANAPRIISDLRRFFPPQQDIFLVGPMAKIGWGTPTLVNVQLGVILEFPSVNITILGVIKVVLPDEEADVLRLQVNFIGRIEPSNQLLWFYAELFDSRVLFITLEGGFGLLVNWGDNANFVISAGGFHPKYSPPPLPFPQPPRIAATILDESYAKVRIEAYFAVTSNSVQFGAKAELFFGVSEFNIEGFLGFDALFQFDPFFFSFSLSVSLSVKVFGIGLFSVGFSGLLEGPTPWYIKGKGSISLLFFSISVPFEHTWGYNQDTKLDPIEVYPILEKEFKALTNWEARLPESSNILVSLRKLGESENDQLVLHPVGKLRISQRKIPVNFKLDKVGRYRSDKLTHFCSDKLIHLWFSSYV
ncbi:MAG: hypothetical protein PVH61_41975 [Candidatus Aminicenantes bacterium]|jgi:hypothetical protein